MAKKKQEEAPSVIVQLRDEIRDSGQSLNELGRASGVSAGQLSRFLRGERNLTSEAIDKICRALRLELRKLTRPGQQEEKPHAGATEAEGEPQRKGKPKK